MKKIEEILAQCIDDVKAGRCSVEDCLLRYPALSKELEPLLQLALSIQPLPDVKPSPAFKVRARVQLMERIHAGQAVTKWPWLRYTSQVKPIIYKRRFSMVPIVIAIVLAVSAMGGGTAYAAQGSLPGDVLYPVKLGTEQVRLILADNAADAELWLEFADRRLGEMAGLNERGRPERIDIAVSRYDEAMTRAMAKVDAVSARGQEVGDLSELVAQATSNHLLVLDGLEDVVAGEAQEAIVRARKASITGLENALRALARVDPGRAMEINLAAMEGRLNRAKAKAEAGEIGAAEAALAQFGELDNFGKEISQIAQGLGLGTTTVEQLVAQATAIQLEVLATVYGIVPEEAKKVIERAMATAIIGYQKAVEALEDKGALGDIPIEPPIPAGIPILPTETPTVPVGTLPIPEGIPGQR